MAESDRQATYDSVIGCTRRITLVNEGYRHALRICNTSFFSMADMITQTRLNVTFMLVHK